MDPPYIQSSFPTLSTCEGLEIVDIRKRKFFTSLIKELKLTMVSLEPILIQS